VVLVHPSQKAIIDPSRGIPENRVEPTMRAQRRLIAIDPLLDVRAAEPSKAEEASARPARFQLSTMLGRMLVCGDVELLIDADYGCCHGAGGRTDGSKPYHARNF